MRAVVTGGAGFIGSHLIEALVARGDEVVCVDRPGASRRWIERVPVEFRHTGLEDERGLVRACVGADVVFHLAGLTEARAPADFYAVNTEGTARVLKAAAAQLWAPRVVVVSSIAALGPCRNGAPLDGDTVPAPISHYGRSKLLAEAVVHAYADRVPAVIVRPASVYGPRERGVLKFFQLVQRGVALTIGAWEREVSLIYVQDLVAALLGAATGSEAVGRAYCLAHPDPVSWARVADVVGAVLDRRPVRLSLPVAFGRVIALGAEACAALRGRPAILNRERVRDLTQRRWVCDPSRAMRELAFQPAYPVERGMAETAAWYREARWL
jgi:nucleoside-diphosphate-sugar epimerase